MDAQIVKTLQDQIDELTQRVNELYTVKSKKNGKLADRFNQLNDIDMMIKDFLEDPDNVIVQNTDLIYSDQLIQILELKYPNVSYFQYSKIPGTAFGKSKEQKARCRSIGGRMTKLGYKTVRSRYYNKVDDGVAEGHTTTRTVWVLRNRDDYEATGEVNIGHIAREQWKVAMDAYNKKKEVSFL